MDPDTIRPLLRLLHSPNTPRVGRAFFALLTMGSLVGWLVGWLGLLSLSFVVPNVVPNAHAEMLPSPYARLGTLDKITGQFSTLNIPVGRTSTFQSSIVTVHACYRSDPQSPPDAAAFLSIVDPQHSKSNVSSGSSSVSPVFEGWMFSSSPGISSFSHPLIDIWVIDCPTKEPPSSSPLNLAP